MSNTMTIGNDFSVGAVTNRNVSGVCEKSSLFTKVMGENLKGIISIPEKPEVPKISSYEDNGEKLSAGSTKDKLESKISKDNTLKGSSKDTAKEISKNADTMKQTCEEAAETVKEEIMKKLNVSDEELEELLTELGLVDLNLLNPQELLNICLQLGGAEEIDLLTNDTLYQAITDIMSDLEDVLGEIEKNCQITPEQLVETLQTIPETDVDEKDTMLDMENVNPVDSTAEEAQQVVEIKTQTAEDETDAHHENEKKSNQQVAHPAADQMTQFQTTETLNAASNEAQVPNYITSSTQNIMTQMIENMRLEASNEVTELKLQLHPESLGNVSVQLTAKEGAVTASFTAQNEIVKNVLETQMIQLKETLQEKGIQVEAIEVKVDAGAYNEQYQDAKGNEDTKEAFEKEIHKNTTRRINLMDYSDTEELGEIDEAEELTVKMMKENGNSLDYSA